MINAQIDTYSRHSIGRRVQTSLRLLALIAVMCVLQVGVAVAQSDVVGWNAADFVWNDAVGPKVVQLEGTTEIRWVPQPFIFEPGQSVRYIDYVGGDDANPGTREQPWKHHPWDANAEGNSAASDGPQTYVFKRGVIYRGALVADDSGTETRPVRLTSDPAWGQGQAVIAGSEGITGGWRKVSAAEAQAAGFPQESNDKLWSVKLDGDYVPRAMWVLGANGQRTRVPIARWPNWKVEHEYNIFTQWFRVEKIDKGFPRTTIYAPKVLNDPDPKAFDGATVWMDHANTSGEFSIIGPFPARAAGYDPATGRLLIDITHPRRHPNPNAPFFLENMAKFLDEAGEWYFSANGADARTLYVRLPGDTDPNTATVEVARYQVILDIVGQRHINVSGLTLTGGNAVDLNSAARAGDWVRPDNYTQMATIRLNNDARHIRLHHLDIRDSAGSGIVHFITQENTTLLDLEIADSHFENIDNEAIHFSSKSAPIKNPSADLMDIRVLRNRISEIGQRCSSDQGGRGIDITGLSVGQIAGNVINRTGGQGINVVGSRMSTEVPLIRIQIDRNQVRDTLLQKQDFGGIEFWGVGPAYVYNNISINPVGLVAHRNVYHKNQAYYFDHGAKGYLFNNIGWSDKREDAYRGILGDYFFHEIRNRWNQAFHNSALNFRAGMTHSSTYGNQQHYLANLLINCRSGSSHWTLDTAAEIAFANNLYAGEYLTVYSRWKGESFQTIDQYRQHVAPMTNHLNKQYGWATDDMPIVDPTKHDFRLADNSAAIDRGVKVFVPWSLYGTVGEWHFRLHPKDPNTVLAYDVFPQTIHRDHGSFRAGSPVPENELTGSGFTAESYIPGILEDWVPGAITFDGTRRLALAQERLIRDIPYTVNNEQIVFPGKERKTVRMTDNNFLMEAVFRTEPGHTGGSIARKLDDLNGYALDIDANGRLAIRLRSAGAQVVASGGVPVNDGKWHHAIAEVDRRAGSITLYLDGKVVTTSQTGTMPAAPVSLDNDVDFIVGEGFVGALDYLRISRGTLADAQTTIAELMAWQFNGPAQHDFVGRPPTGARRDIGAVEHPTIGQQQAIRFTPPAPPTPALTEPQAGGEDAFKPGDDRTVKTFGWGAVSVPKQVAIGQELDVQVAFATETIDKPQVLRIDLHGYVGKTRVPGLSHASPIKVTPGVTSPYVAKLKVNPKEGLTAVTLVLYVSPDGSYDKKVLSTEIGIPLVAQKKPAKAAAPAEAPAANVEVPMQTKETEWSTARWPKSASVGQTVPIEITFKQGALTSDAKLRVDTHWYEGRKRNAGGPRSRLLTVKANDPQTITVNLTVPDKANITAVTYVVYVGPTGGWDDKTHVVELGMNVTKAQASDAPVKGDPAKNAPPEADAPKTDAAPRDPATPKGDQAPASAGELITKETPWGSFTLTSDPKVGQEAVVTITLKEGVVTAPTKLTVDMHWWKGKTRSGSLGRFGQRTIQPGQTGPFVFKKVIPQKDGIASIAAVISLSPDGSWSAKTHSIEIGTRVPAE